MIVFQPFKYMYSKLRRKNEDLQLICEVFDRVELNFEINNGNVQALQTPAATPTATGAGITNYCVAYNPTNASVTGGDFITFGTNLVDTASIHSTSVNPSRFIAPNNGFYLLGGQVQVAGDDGTGTERDVQLYINGSPVNPFSGMGTNLGPFLTVSQHPPVNLAVPDFTIMNIGFIKLNKNDYMQVRYGSDSGSLGTETYNSAWGTMIQFA